jgi:hypothetical protein
MSVFLTLAYGDKPHCSAVFRINIRGKVNRALIEVWQLEKTDVTQQAEK